MAILLGGKDQRFTTLSACRCCDPQLHRFTARACVALSRRSFVTGAVATAGLAAWNVPITAQAEAKPRSATLFENVQIFDGTSDALSPPSNVLVADNLIKTISAAPIAAPTDVTLVRIAGGGRTLMPGLIENPAQNFLVIMKDGQVHKNIIAQN